MWRKSSIPSNFYPSDISNSFEVVKIKSREINLALNNCEFIKSRMIAMWVRSPLSFSYSGLLISLSATWSDLKT